MIRKERDFTINAMFIGLNKKNKYKLVDPFNGLSDLKNGIIKPLLNQTRHIQMTLLE